MTTAYTFIPVVNKVDGQITDINNIKYHSIHLCCVPSITRLEVYKNGHEKFLLVSHSEAAKVGLPQKYKEYDLFLIPLNEIPEFKKYLEL